jgi:3-hydroxymyristoyl/3-hydroxydecanoyl-(acyl carrier protein) dehydratase
MPSAAATVSANFTIPLDHPALPGHFPGNPVVPGVVILDQVIRELATVGVPAPRLRRLQQVKFIEPLLPDQEATLTAEVGDTLLSFSVSQRGRTITKGAFVIGHEFAR